MHNHWANFIFHAIDDEGLASYQVYSRAVGRYAITGMRSTKVPKHEDRDQDRDYPEFIYGIDDATGQVLTHTCDPEQLGNYFEDDGRLHYLTPIYFRREVLQPYDNEPNRCRLTVHRLTCLNLWGVDISFNSAGLVEVYLGDIGTYIPSDDWGHWRSYNVPPEGQMSEDRFRRDFLNQVTPAKDVPGDLRRAREAVNRAAERLLGDHIWKPLTGDIAVQWESLLPPLTDDPAALGVRLLTMTKVLIDGIDPAPLKQSLKTWDKDERSLGLLSRFVTSLGGDEDLVTPLRQLQTFRSRGGVAHLAGSGKPKAEAELGIAGLSNVPAFDRVAIRAAESLRSFEELILRAVHSHEVQ